MNISKFRLEGDDEALKKVEELIRQLDIARSLVKDLAEIKITILDTRKKEINEYINELRNDFIRTYGYEPLQLYLAAEGNSHSIRMILNKI